MDRNQITNLLVEKVLRWAVADSQASAYNNLDSNPNMSKFQIERDSNGYFYYSDSLVSYCDLRTGEIFRVRRYWEPQDWNCYNQLYQRGLQVGFRIDIPLHRDTVEILGNVWEYAEFQSPGGDYGQNYNDDVFTWPELVNGLEANPSITDQFREEVKAYYMEFVDQVGVIIKEAKNTAIDNMCGLPLGLSYIFNRYKDEHGYFWSDFDHYAWTRTGTDVLDNSMWFLKETLMFGVVCGAIDEARGIEVTNYAREKWATI